MCLRGDSRIQGLLALGTLQLGCGPSEAAPGPIREIGVDSAADPGCWLHPVPHSRVWAASRGRAPPGAPYTGRPALTAQVVGPLVQHALHGARGPLTAPARRGDAGPASHPGPGGGVTATAWEHQLRVWGLRLRLAQSVWTRQSGRRREAREARPGGGGRGRLPAATEPTAPAPARSRMPTAPRARSQIHARVWPRRKGAGWRAGLGYARGCQVTPGV